MSPNVWNFVLQLTFSNVRDTAKRNVQTIRPRAPGEGDQACRDGDQSFYHTAVWSRRGLGTGGPRRYTVAGPRL